MHDTELSPVMPSGVITESLPPYPMNGPHELLCIVLVAIDCQSAGVAARTLANIACLLSCMARGRGGLQSGPAANLQWKPAMLLLEVVIDRNLNVYFRHALLLQSGSVRIIDYSTFMF